MDKRELFDKMFDAVLKGDKESAVNLTKKSIEMNIDPTQVLEEGFTPALRKVGELWEEGEYFLPELVMSSEAMKSAMNILKPCLENKEEKSSKIGKVVIGTIEGDIHDIGKTLVASLLSSAGFDVIDLGTDVKVEKFIETAKRENPDIIGMSALLTTTMMGQKKVIERLKEEGMRDKIKVLVGGAPVDKNWAKEIGADDAPSGAVEAIQSAKKLIAVGC